MKDDYDENVTVQLEPLELYDESRSKVIQHEQKTDGNNSQTLELPEELLGNTEHVSDLTSPSTNEVDE